MTKIIDRLGLRYSEGKDMIYLYNWLLEDSGTDAIRAFFMLDDPASLAVGANRWGFSFMLNASITLTLDDIPIGIGSLWLNDLPVLSHQGMFGMMIARDYRGYGFGSLLCNNIIHFAKHYFNFEKLVLQVMGDNTSAVRLYEKFGFKCVYIDETMLKRPNGEYQEILLMERKLR